MDNLNDMLDKFPDIYLLMRQAKKAKREASKDIRDEQAG